MPEPGRMRGALVRLPMALVVARACAAPVALILGWGGEAKWLAAVIVLATATDIADGIIARRLGVSTVALRRYDSSVDLAFWLSTLAALYLLRPAAMATAWPAFAAGLAVEIVLQGLSYIRFRRMSATHARSAKFFGLCLLVGGVMLALGGSAATAGWIVGIGVLVSGIDRLLIGLLLPRWEADVPSAWAAWSLRRGRAIRRHWLG